MIKNKIYDVIILGAGPAGLAAAIYASRYRMKNIVVSKDIGGTANWAEMIENYPSFIGTGRELMKKFHEQAKKFGTKFLQDEIINIKKGKNKFIVETRKNKLKSKIIIIALGTERRKLNIPGEAEFLGKGVSYCSTCDAFFFKDKIVAVIGGSDCAVTSAIALVDVTKKVYIIYRGKDLRCEEIYKEKIKQKKIHVIYETVPIEIKGKETVESLVIKKKGKIEEINLDGVFIEIGSLPISELVRELGIRLDKEDYIITDKEMKTNIKRVFAAGDITAGKLKQVLISACQGAIAAKSAYDYISINK